MFTKDFTKPKRRSGVAAVEMIPCLGLILALTFGTIEVCGGYQVSQALHVAAFEGVRAGIRRDRDEEAIYRRTRDVLEFYDIDWSAPGLDGSDRGGIPNQSSPPPPAGEEPTDPEYGIFIETPDGRPLNELNALELVTVRIVVPAEKNASPILRHLFGRKISATVSMVREFDPPEPEPEL